MTTLWYAEKSIYQFLALLIILSAMFKNIYIDSYDEIRKKIKKNIVGINTWYFVKFKVD